MKGMLRALALGAVLAAGTATAGMAQGVNNTGYNRNGPIYGDGYYGYPGEYYRNPGYYGYPGGYYGDEGRTIRNPGYGPYGYAPGPVEAPVIPPDARPYGYYGNSFGYGSSYPPGWGSGGGAAYDRGYTAPYNYGYGGR
jgi:hypothetical protein